MRQTSRIMSSGQTKQGAAHADLEAIVSGENENRNYVHVSQKILQLILKTLNSDKKTILKLLKTVNLIICAFLFQLH